MEGPTPGSQILHMPAQAPATPSAHDFLAQLAQGILGHRLQLEAARSSTAALEAMIPALEDQLVQACEHFRQRPQPYLDISHGIDPTAPSDT